MASEINFPAVMLSSYSFNSVETTISSLSKGFELAHLLYQVEMQSTLSVFSGVSANACMRHIVSSPPSVT
jgi:hypothetical protein